MADAKLVQLVQALLDKTRRGRLKWTRTSSATMFVAQITAQEAVAIRNGPAGTSLDILDAAGHAIESAGASELQMLAMSQPVMTNMNDLYEAARKSAAGTDQMVSNLLDALNRL